MRLVRALFLFSAALAAAFAQGSIEGLVVNPGNNSPARNATVTLTYMPMRTSATGVIGSFASTFSADTDSQGRFSFADLQAGTYRARVQRRNSAGPMNGAEIQLYLGDGQQLKDIVLSMPTQAVVAGKVLDEFGEPVERAQVSLLRPQSAPLRGRQWVPMGNATSNDLGEYRITVSTPGDYIVCASLTNIFRSGFLNQPLPDKPEMAYVGTCHPSATEISGAATLTVGTAEIDSVDIKLQKVPTVRIRGRLISPPLPDNRRTSPMLQPRDGVEGAMPGRNFPAMTNPDGAFEFSGVKAGSYILSAQLMIPRGGGAVGPADRYLAALPVDLTDKSIEGLTLTLAPSKSVHGAIRFEGNPPTNLGRLQVLVTPVDTQSMGMGMAQAQVSGNSFVIPNVSPGPSVVSVNSGGNWYAKSYRYGGKEIPPAGVDLTTGAELEIVLGGDGAQLRGTVANAAGEPLFGGVVSILATDGPQPSVPTPFTGPGGSYVFPFLRPGEYQLFAWEAVDAAQAQSPDYLRQFADKATTVKLEPGGVANVPLKPISAADTGLGPDTSPPAFVHAKGSLEGQVLNAVNGQPVANATVRLNGGSGGIVFNGNIRRGTYSAPPTPGMLTARSDEQGRFVFPSLEPGVYMASTGAEGFQPRVSNVSRESIIVGEGQHVRNAVVKLSPPIAISGKVVDEHGMGLPNTRLTVLEIDYSSGKPVLTATNQGADTDESGEYKISMPAGDYTLGARYLDRTPPDFLPQRPLPAISDFGYPVTYYPGTPDADAAKPLTLDAEGNAIANLTLVTTPMWRIRGQVVNPHGPLPRLNVTVFANDRSARAVLGPWFVALNPDGAFEVSGLPSGSYTVVARSTGPGQNSAAVEPVEVRGKSVGGVKLELASGRDVEASILTDDGSPVPSIPIAARLTPLDDRPSMIAAQQSGSKLAFHNLAPLPYTISVQVSPACNCYVKSIRYGGREMPESGAILTGGEPFEIVLGMGLASLEGTVVDAQGQPAAGAAVVLAPRNAALTTIKKVAADSHGRFVFPGNPPGEYKLLAWADGAMDPIHVPALLVQNDARAKTLNLSRGGRQTVQVTAIPR